MKTLDGKVALITGSSRGIGQAIAEEFARQGCAVFVHGRDREALNRVETAINNAGGRVMSVIADVTDFEQIEAMRRTIEDGFGPVDIRVANAG
jgi:3-oxoacyl-[acyl-carrier protein] reductase